MSLKIFLLVMVSTADCARVVHTDETSVTLRVDSLPARIWQNQILSDAETDIHAKYDSHLRT